MFHLDIQQIVTFALVALAAYSVGRRLWGQIAAFRSRPARRKAGVSPKRGGPAASPSPLIQVQMTPPARLKRPPAEPITEDPRANP